MHTPGRKEGGRQRRGRKAGTDGGGGLVGFNDNW